MLDSTIGDYMTPTPHTIGYDQSLSSAARLMDKHGIRHLPVLDGGQIVGIVSDRDIAFVEALQSFDPERMPVDEAISGEPYVVGPEIPLVDVVRTMAEKRYGSAIIEDQGRALGVFTTIDALRILASLIDGTTAN